MIKIFIIVGALIFLFLILFLIKRKKKKSKKWFLFQKTEGYENNLKKSFFVINKKTGIKKFAHPIAKPNNIHFMDDGGYIKKIIR